MLVGAVQTALSVSNSAVEFTTRVANIGGQNEIDECTGGLTEMETVSEYLGRPYYPIHYECGGAQILNLKEGEQVHIDDVGDYLVLTTTDINRGDTAAALKDFPGEAILQTCHPTGPKMRVVTLAARS